MAGQIGWLACKTGRTGYNWQVKLVGRRVKLVKLIENQEKGSSVSFKNYKFYKFYMPASQFYLPVLTSFASSTGWPQIGCQQALVTGSGQRWPSCPRATKVTPGGPRLQIANRRGVQQMLHNSACAAKIAQPHCQQNILMGILTVLLFRNKRVLSTVDGII